MRYVCSLAVVAVCCFLSVPAIQAQETSAEQEAQKCTSCTQTTSAVADQECDGACPVMTAALAKLPTMTYQIGEESTCCSESAAALADKHSLPVQFVVAETTYDDQSAAYTALVETTESFVSEFATPHQCEASGSITVAGKSCNCPVTSAGYATKVKEAMDAVQISYQVGEESCDCPNRAAMVAKESGQETHFVIGEETTSCEMEARLKLAHARYMAAVQTMAAIEAESAEAEAALEGSDS